MNQECTSEGAEGRDSPVIIGFVGRISESELDDFLKLLDSVPELKLIYRKIARYELYISPYPPNCWTNKGA